MAAALDVAGREGREIERKYLLSALPAGVRPDDARELDQGYLPGTAIAERIRRTRMGSECEYYRTIKTGSGLDRREIEEETTAALFEALWPLTRGRRVHKRRYALAAATGDWVVDEFLDRDLVLAEVELERPDAPATPPDSVAAVLVRDVTGDPSFSNYRLAK